MEAKQSREKDRPKALVLAGQPDLFLPDAQPRGQRSANRVWDQLMIGARHQAQEHARALPASHGWPPFVLLCDVGHCIDGELRLARVTRQGASSCRSSAWSCASPRRRRNHAEGDAPVRGDRATHAVSLS